MDALIEEARNPIVMPQKIRAAVAETATHTGNELVRYAAIQYLSLHAMQPVESGSQLAGFLYQIESAHAH